MISRSEKGKFCREKQTTIKIDRQKCPISHSAKVGRSWPSDKWLGNSMNEQKKGILKIVNSRGLKDVFVEVH